MAAIITENGFAVAAASALLVVGMVSCCGAEKDSEEPVSIGKTEVKKKGKPSQSTPKASEKASNKKSKGKGNPNENESPSLESHVAESDVQEVKKEVTNSKKKGKKNKKNASKPQEVKKIEVKEEPEINQEDKDQVDDSILKKPSTKVKPPAKVVPLEDGWTAVESIKKDRKSKDKTMEPVPEPEPVKVEEGAVAEVVVKPSQPNTTVAVDPKKLGVVIGPKGSTMKRIEEVTQCRLRTLDNDQDTQAKSAYIRVEGADINSVHEACKIVTDLCSKGYSAKLEGGDFVEVVLKFPSRSIPDLVGTHGVVLKALRDSCGVVVNLPPQKKLTSGVEKDVKVTVAGPRAGVEQAQSAINDILTKYYSSVTHPGFTHAEFEVAEWQMGRFCGKAGSNIRHIQGDSKARVYISRDGGEKKKVLVVGTSQQVGIAKKHVVRILESIKEEANKISSEESFASAHRANKPDEEEEPHEEWMDEYLYKR